MMLVQYKPSQFKTQYSELCSMHEFISEPSNQKEIFISTGSCLQISSYKLYYLPLKAVSKENLLILLI